MCTASKQNEILALATIAVEDLTRNRTTVKALQPLLVIIDQNVQKEPIQS